MALHIAIWALGVAVGCFVISREFATIRVEFTTFPVNAPCFPCFFSFSIKLLRQYYAREAQRFKTYRYDPKILLIRAFRKLDSGNFLRAKLRKFARPSRDLVDWSIIPFSTTVDDGDENKFSVDKGGYWVGTDKSLNASIAASVLRQSIVNVRGSHPDELRAMQERFPGVGTHDLVRFLQAREFNVANAGDMLEAHEAWRRETLPIPYESVRDTIATRKFYVLDDKDGGGRPVLFFCLHRFMDAPYVVEDEIRALLYLLEETVSRKMGNSFETQKWSVFIDVSGIRSPPLQFLQKMNSVMEANYPERLYRTVMFPVPFWLQKVISACVTFMAEETRNKFAYVNDIRSLEEYAMMPVEKMGLDVNDMVKSKRLK